MKTPIRYTVWVVGVLILIVKEFLITDGAVLWADAGSGRHHELSGIRFSVKDFH